MMSGESEKVCNGGTSKIVNDSCKDGASKSNYNLNDMLNNMSIDDNTVSVCANCGKEGDDVNNTCNKCKMVKYCNAACKKKHRHKHKKECEEFVRCAAEKHEEELRLAAEKQDEELFKQPPPEEDCPICFLLLPTLPTGRRYQTCCGKFICSGCVHAPLYDDRGNEVDNQKCAFCRVPGPDSDEEMIKRTLKRVEVNDPIAIFNRGNHHRDGSYGTKQDHNKALELFNWAGELGYADAYGGIGNAYDCGYGVGVDKKKAKHYYELAAMAGSVISRHNLGVKELDASNFDRALKHYMIAVASGDSESLPAIKKLYSSGHATKEDYATALQLFQTHLGEIKSAQRDEAAAAYEDQRYRYY